MKTTMEIGGGSTAGSMHKNANKNNQDSFACREGNGYVVSVVADGCGSAPRSEFGSHLIAYRVAEALDSGMTQAHANGPIEYDPQNPWPKSLYESIVNQAVNDALGSLDAALRTKRGCQRGDLRHFSEVLYEYGLCTLVMMIVTNTYVGIWSIGDGAYAVLFDIHDAPGFQLEFKSIEPCEGNKPPYLGYRLDPRTVFEEAHLLHPIQQFSIALPCGDDCRLMGAAIMSDGFGSEHEEHIRHILSDPSFTSNPHKTTQYLNKLNGGKQKIDWDNRRITRQPSIFKDDATIVFVQFHIEGEVATATMSQAISAKVDREIIEEVLKRG